MKRRQVLAALGAVSGSGALLTGTGAFTSVSADRNVAVSVAGDTSAFLQLQSCPGSPNGEYAQINNGKLELDLTDDNPTSGDGTGVNADATTVFDNVFEIANQGTQPVGVWLNVDPADTENGDPAIELYRNGDQSNVIIGQSNAYCLGVGDSICVGFVIRTQRISNGEDLFASMPGSGGEAMVINADAEVGCEAPSGGGSSGLRRLSTGVADWQVTSLPSGVSAPAGDTPYSAYEITPPEVWSMSSTDAEWVDPFDDGGRIDDPEGDYDYELEFDVSTERTLVIEEYGSDNEVEFFLNGASIGGTGGGNAFQSLRSNISSQTVASGSHTLKATVTNRRKNQDVPDDKDTNPTGLLVAARLDP